VICRDGSESHGEPMDARVVCRLKRHIFEFPRFREVDRIRLRPDWEPWYVNGGEAGTEWMYLAWSE